MREGMLTETLPETQEMVAQVRRVVKAAGEAQALLGLERAHAAGHGSTVTDDDLDALTAAIVRDETLTPEEMWERCTALEVAAREARHRRMLEARRASLGDRPAPRWVKRA